MSGGWDRSDFEADEQFDEWVLSRPAAADYYAAVDRIMTVGLPAILQVKWTEGFARIDLIPLHGWTWLATPSSVVKETLKGWAPHVSISKYTVNEVVFQRLVDRYHNTETAIRIARVTCGAVAVLAWEGLGGDLDLWTLYEDGEFGYRWRENGCGPHISM